MNLVSRIVVLALPFVVGTVACVAPTEGTDKAESHIVDDEEAATRPAPKADASAPAPDFCKTYCAKVHGCDESVDADTCENECENVNAATLPKYRTDVIASITSCVDAKDCRTVLAQKAVAACVDEAAASVAPSEATTKTCAALASSSTKCKATFDRAACLEQGKLFDDEALADAEGCAQKACTDVDACLEAAVGSPLGRKSVQCTSFGDGKEFDTDTASCDSCMAGSCCAESDACAANASCRSLVRCVSACSTEACVDDCAYDYPSGIAPANQLFSCMNDRCSSACN